MKKFWTEITRSQFAWEQEALEFIRQQLPDHEPYRAWSNFEFIADDGSINEIDLLVLTPKGFFLVEIKSRPGRLTGNAGTWVWVQDGREQVNDNPLILTNRKAKKLISLLRRQKAFKKDRPPFLEALVFCSALDLKCDLDQHARTGVWLRDRGATEGKPGRQGIIHALTKAMTPEEVRRFQNIDRLMARKVSRALEEAGIRRSNKYRKVGQYKLGSLLAEEDIYQEWEAQHMALENTRRRVRIYPVSSKEQTTREAIIRAVKREFQILEGIEHPGILRAENYVEHELGPALIFEHHPESLRLDHYLIKLGDALSMDQRIHLLRQIGEALGYAHQKRLIHRALSPQSILIIDPESALPRIKIFNWQTARRRIETATSIGFTATRHVQDLVEGAAMVYLAPEVHTDPSVSGEELDLFSLGAIAYHILSGQPPAETIYELVDKLSEQDGLQISSVMDGAGEKLQELIQYATHRDASLRIDVLKDFFDLLNDVEEELTRPEEDESCVKNPTEAGVSDRLQGGFLVKKRLGHGSTSVAFLVEKDGCQTVLKLAADYDHNDRVREEAKVLEEIRHSGIVALSGEVEVNGYRGLLLQFANKGTLADRIRKEGRIHSELLERFGVELLQALNHLEEHGISHRDIKPGNLGLVESGSKGKLHLILFDFSLARVSPENIRAGTLPYLDPFLKDASRRRWDLHAERFTAAMTLYEMATGTLPKWADGRSDPALLECEATIDGELFEPSLREGFSGFFAKALARNVRDRFDTCEEMLKAFSQLFWEVERSEQRNGAGEAKEWDDLHAITLKMPVAALPFSDRALSALERCDARTVADFLAIHIFRLSRMRGVGRQTQKELTQAHRQLAKQFPNVGAAKPVKQVTSSEEVLDLDIEVQSIDLLVHQLIPKPARAGSEAEFHALSMHLGLMDPQKVPLEESLAAWPSQIEIAQSVKVTRGRISQILSKARSRWSKRITSLTALRGEIAELLANADGVMTLRELGEAILVRRGSAQIGEKRSRTAQAVTRAALEVERGKQEPRWIERRSGQQLLLALDEKDRGQELADYALRLGRRADDLASRDPLLTPARVMEVLQKEQLPEEVLPMSTGRLLKLAVMTSQSAALSSRMEIYPKGLTANRALKLAQGALLGAQELTIDQVRERVMGRYPEVEPLPDRPQLDALLEEAGCRFEWNPTAGTHREGLYQAVRHEHTTVHLTTTTRMSFPDTETVAAETGISPEQADAQAFQQRLDKAALEGSFLALRVPPKHSRGVEKLLKETFKLTVYSFDVLLVTALKEVAKEKRIKRWQVILDADSEGHNGSNWRKLMGLVGLAIPQVETQLKSEPGTVLLTDPGLLARYGKMDMISRLQDQTLRLDGLHGLWMLIPSDDQSAGPSINGEAVPVITPGQWARVPSGWTNGLHQKRN